METLTIKYKLDVAILLVFCHLYFKPTHLFHPLPKCDPQGKFQIIHDIQSVRSLSLICFQLNFTNSGFPDSNMFFLSPISHLSPASLPPNSLIQFDS